MSAQTQSQTAILALDVGGTTVDGGVVTPRGKLIDPIQSIKSPSEKPAEIILQEFGTLLQNLRDAASKKGFAVAAVGIGMPGPFDYERGVSWMQHKFKALYGKNLKEPIEKRLGMPVFFVNDALAFALGVWWAEYQNEQRLLAITLGTGLGSGFLVNGRPASEKDGAPPSGEIWNFPYRGGILEDAASRRAIEREYQNRGGKGNLEVRDIAAQARKGNVAAIEAFAYFGEALGEGLALVAAPFRPTRIVCGGQISKAFDLFGKRAQDVLSKKAGYSIPIVPTQKRRLALLGAAHYAFSKLGVA